MAIPEPSTEATTPDESVANGEKGSKIREEFLGPGEAWLIEHIRYQVFTMRLNRVITAVGPPGSGKSWTGLRIGPMVDPTFDIQRVVFPGLDYIRAIANPDLGIGSFVEWDDAGLGAPAREFWSLLNRAVGMVAQSSRFRRLILWVTLPDKSFLDSQPRKLVDIHLEFMRRDTQDQPIAARIYLPETNAKTGKIYYKHPRIDVGNGPEVLDIIRFHTPPDKALSEAYENRKARYMMSFYKNLVDEIETGGIAMGDHQARVLITLDKYRAELGRTKTQAAKAIGIRLDSYSRALRKASRLTGLAADGPEAA